MPTSTPRPPATPISPTLLLVLLTGFVALQPLATDMFLPSLPGIGREFNAPISAVQWTLSIFIIGFGLSQLLAGPLSDRYGRYPVLVGGIGIFALASFAAIFAPDLQFLVICRFFQAAGACSGLLGARAMIRDLYSPQEGARMLASALTLMTVVPLLGPILAGWLDTHGGFRAVLMVFTAFGTLLCLLTWWGLQETSAQLNHQAMRLKPMLRNYAAVARSPVFWTFTLLQSASFAGLFAFLSGSPFVFIRVLGLSAAEYGWVFAIASLGYLSGSLLCRRLLPRLKIQRTLYVSATLALLGGGSQALIALSGSQNIWVLILPQYVYMMGHGLTSPCAQAGAVAPFPQNAGTAAALMGFIMSCVGACVGAWMGYSFNHTSVPLATTIGACGLCVALITALGVRHYGNLSSPSNG